MARVKKLKRKPNKRRRYTSSQLVEAIELAKSGEKSVYTIAKEMKIPRSTIQNHIKGLSTGFRVGRPPLFSEDQEKVLVDFTIQLSEYGYPASKSKLKRIAHSYAEICRIKIKGEKWKPGEDWLYGYVCVKTNVVM